jgi:dephospho-CoA kinase
MPPIYICILEKKFLMDSKIIKIGITGNIGSGKSIVSDYIEKNGYTVLRSDLIAKDLIVNNQSVKRKIVNLFGKETYLNGKLNTKLLAAKVFNNKKNVKLINSIVHPAALRKIDELIRAESKNSKIIFIESALIFEAKIEKMFDHIVLVYSDKKNRIDRLMKRENVDIKEVLKRMKYQIDDGKKKNKVDFIITNNSTIQHLHQSIKFLLRVLGSLSKMNK